MAWPAMAGQSQPSSHQKIEDVPGPQAFTEINAFLKDHPSEVVFVMLKQESKGRDVKYYGGKAIGLKAKVKDFKGTFLTFGLLIS